MIDVNLSYRSFYYLIQWRLSLYVIDRMLFGVRDCFIFIDRILFGVRDYFIFIDRMLFGVRDCFIFVYNGKKFLIRDSIVLSHLTEVSKIPLQLIYIDTSEILRFPSESKTSFSPSFKKHLFHCVTSH